MKITKQRLNQIIKEEVERGLNGRASNIGLKLSALGEKYDGKRQPIPWRIVERETGVSRKEISNYLATAGDDADVHYFIEDRGDEGLFVSDPWGV